MMNEQEGAPIMAILMTIAEGVRGLVSTGRFWMGLS